VAAVHFGGWPFDRKVDTYSFRRAKHHWRRRYPFFSCPKRIITHSLTNNQPLRPVGVIMWIIGSYVPDTDGGACLRLKWVCHLHRRHILLYVSLAVYTHRTITYIIFYLTRYLLFKTLRIHIYIGTEVVLTQQEEVYIYKQYLVATEIWQGA